MIVALGQQEMVNREGYRDLTYKTGIKVKSDYSTILVLQHPT